MKSLSIKSAYWKCIITLQIISLLSLTTHQINAQSQTLVNQLWELELNYPDTVQWSASVLNGSNLITTGNTWNSAAQKTNIVTTKTDQGGNVVWQTEYNGTASEFDYGAAITLDGSGNVFVTGASHASDDYTFDVVVIKYNSSGVQQWATTFDGTGNNNDIPSDILLVGSDIYVCAASIGSSTQYDYLLLKLNSSGTVQWNKRYDYASLYDIPGHLATNGTQIVVSGASQSTATNWDYTSLKYNSSGTLINTIRNTATGYGFDRPTGLVVDASDNFYVTGYTFNGTNYDMRTIKLDDDLSTIWTKTENGGAEDGSNAICIDGSDNIYIAGYSEGSAGNKLMQIIKYNSAGTKQWTKTLQNTSIDIDAEATGITYNSTSNRVIITGFYEYTSGKKVITTYALRTDNGNLAWKNDYPNLSASIDIPTNVLANNNYVWVYGRRTDDDTTRYITIKYELYENEQNVVVDSLSNPSFMDNEIIVRFNPTYINYEFIDNKQVVFSNLSEALADTLYDILEPIINPQNIQFTSKAIKIFKHFTSGDTISISRLGDTVKIKKLWSALKITLPETTPINTVIDTLNNLNEFIFYAHKNGIYLHDDIPNDFYIADDIQQESLIPTAAFPDADINMDAAWDIETGKEYIKVGVVDEMIFWGNEDFGDGTFTGSKIAGGYDYFNDLSVEDSDNPPGSHGTACAGIIGALRNNEIGIAGIAGGDVAGTGVTGVSLYSIGVFFEGVFTTIENGAEAIAESSVFNPATETGFGLHIQNISWGGTVDYQLLEDAVETAYRNNCILVISRGNEGDDVLRYPACYNDDWIINVGASGTDGSHKTEFNGDNWWEGSFGGNVDLIAPGTTQIVATTINPDFPFTWGVCDVDLDEYSCFNGSSAAAPHVAGVAALMLSRHNIEQGYLNNLAMEDVENIIQNTAIDVVGPFAGGFNYPVGPDPENGFGLIEATDAMEAINLPDFMIFHNSEPVSESITTAAHMYVTVLDPESGLASGNYFADRYQINRTYLNVFPSTTDILDSWIRWSSTVGTSAANPIGGEQYADFSFSIIDNVASVSVTTFAWHITESVGTGGAVDVWIPTDLDHIRTDYSLHLFDPTGIVNVNNETTLNNLLLIYPNPNDGEFSIDVLTEGNGMIYIYNQLGELCYSQGISSFVHDNYKVDISNQPAGLYLFKYVSGNTSHSGKIIIQ